MTEIVHIEQMFKKKLYVMLQRGIIEEWAMGRLRLSEDPTLQKIYEVVEGNVCKAA